MFAMGPAKANGPSHGFNDDDEHPVTRSYTLTPLHPTPRHAQVRTVPEPELAAAVVSQSHPILASRHLTPRMRSPLLDASASSAG